MFDELKPVAALASRLLGQIAGVEQPAAPTLGPVAPWGKDSTDSVPDTRVVVRDHRSTRPANDESTSEPARVRDHRTSQSAPVVDGRPNERVDAVKGASASGGLSLAEAAERVARGDTDLLQDPRLKDQLKDPENMNLFNLLLGQKINEFKTASNVIAAINQLLAAIVGNVGR